MPLSAVHLTAEVMEAVDASWPGLDVDRVHPQRLYGGEESAAFRLGELVIRIGPEWRSTEEAEWCHALAAGVRRRISCALAPLQGKDGHTTVRVSGRPVSVWPFVEGRWGDREDPQQVTEAAVVLAGLHRALAACHPGRRPPRTCPTASVFRLEDPDLDRWLAEFAHHHPLIHPLHGDFYPGNVLVRDGRIVAVLDWDEAFVAAPEVELASAACEWGGVLWRTDFLGARSFMADYGAAGGTAELLDDAALAQLYRQRLRSDVSYTDAAHLRGAETNDDDRRYRDRQIEVFDLLAP